MTVSDKDLGLIEGRVEALTERLDKIEPKIDSLLEFVSQNRGAWKALMFFSSASAAAGSIATWVVDHTLKVIK